MAKNLILSDTFVHEKVQRAKYLFTEKKREQELYTKN
jgi:hypothetical protein